MKKYHINDKGEVRPCSAVLSCRFGDVTEHYETVQGAQISYEMKQDLAKKLEGFKKPKKEKANKRWGKKKDKISRKNKIIGMLLAATAVSAAVGQLKTVDPSDYTASHQTPVVQTQEALPDIPGYESPSEVSNLDKLKDTAQKELEKAKELANSPKAQEYQQKLNDLANASWDQVQEYLKDFELGSDGSSGNTASKEYNRAAFKHWTDLDQNGCDTRQDILQRDMTNIQMSSTGCTVLSGTLKDPYTGETIRYERGNDSVDIDHVLSLSTAWGRGADQWSDAKREAFANDPLNLVAVKSSANRSKGAQTPATWTPSNKDYSCAYGTNFIQVANKYGLFLTQAEIDSVNSSCS